MEDFFVCTSHYIKLISENKNLKIDDFHFSNDYTLLERLTYNSLCIRDIGYINLPCKIKNKPPFFYGNLKNIPYEDRIRKSEKGLERYQAILFNLWFLKDCSCNSRFYYDISNSCNKVFYRQRTTVFSNSRGVYGDVFFNIEDIKKSFDITQKIIQLHHNIIEEKEIFNSKPNQKLGNITPSDHNYIRYSNTNRIERAYTFLTMARSQSFLPLKVSFYIGLLETLFTTDGTEVTHKVSERLAFYLSEDFEKKETFDFVKECYGIRSKFVHGQKLHKKYDYETLVSKSVKIDEIVRKLMNKVILIDSQTFLQGDKGLNEYFKNLVFSN